MDIDDDASTLLDSMHGICYLVDADYRIVAIGHSNWNAFARANNGEHLLDGAEVIGRSILDFVSGASVLDAWRRTIEAVATGACRGVIQLTARCDSPSVRRELAISVTPVRRGDRVVRVLIQSLVVSEQRRPQMGVYDFAAINARSAWNVSAPILTMCSYCQNVRFPIESSDATGEWIDAQEYYRRGGDASVRISHGLCPACVARTEKLLAA